MASLQGDRAAQRGQRGSATFGMNHVDLTPGCYTSSSPAQQRLDTTCVPDASA